MESTAKKLRADPAEDTALARFLAFAEAPAARSGETENIIHLPLDIERAERSSAFNGRDVEGALKLIHEAARRVRIAEENARDSEARAQALLKRATDELRGADARLRAAEARAEEAENWLRQIFSTLGDELGSGDHG